MLRLGMGAGLHFCFLDSIKAALERRHPDGKLTSMDAFIAGGVSRAGAAIISCPVTVVKTRMEYGGPGGTQYKVISVAVWQSLAQTLGIRSPLMTCSFASWPMAFKRLTVLCPTERC